jgi:pyruvate dehydrogenase E2 component (dihydrolipoamide acetyltransferase)
MRVEITMPNLGFDMEAGTIVSWLVAVGDSIERGQPIAEIETDKTTVEMEALQTGTLLEIIQAAGSEVAVGEVIGAIEAVE